MLLNLVTKIDSIWIVSCSWSNHTILLLMFVAEKVLLLLVISLTAYCTPVYMRSSGFCAVDSTHNLNSPVIQCSPMLPLKSGNSDLSNMAELPSFSPPASESTLQYRTSPPLTGPYEAKAQSCSRVHIVICDYRSLVISVLCNSCVITKSLVL